MTKITVLFLTISILFSSCKSDKTRQSQLEITKGIPLEIAQYRQKHYKNVNYKLRFDIPESKTTAIVAENSIRLDIDDVSEPLLLDFNVDSAHLKQLKVNGKSIKITHEAEHIIIDNKHLILGANTIFIEFIAGELSLNRNDDFLYTLLVPDRASTVFPCFDQPDIKARYDLELTVPATWKTMGNAPLQKREIKDDKIIYTYKNSDPMSTYLFSFVAGTFERIEQTPGHFKMSMLHREDNKERLEESTNEIFKIHEASLTFLEDYTNYQFPFQKFDFVTIPGFQYGGMEHVGAIQYRQSSLFLNKSATQVQKLSRARLIAHETAHMWFGDLVTMKWFNDVWMKEVFANFMADKIVNPSFPEINHKLQFLTAHYPSAYSEDRTTGSTPIRQHLDNLKNAGTLYGRIIYNKAPIMMRQLEILIGEEKFKDGVQEYITTYAFKNADWPELITILNTKTETDLNEWSDVWVNKSGRPKFKSLLEEDNGIIKSFSILQEAEDGSDKLWTQLFDIAFVYENDIKVIPVNIDNKKNEIAEVKGWPIPKDIIFNYNGVGYGIFPLNNKALELIPKLRDPVARAQSYLNLYENMLDGTIEPLKVINFLQKHIRNEKEELILSLMSNQIQTIFWTFISEENRNTLVLDLEKDIKKELLGNHPSNIKRTYFNLYRNIAYNSPGKTFLYELWSKKKDINGLNLSNNDIVELAAALALFNHEKSNYILETTLEQIQNKDRKKRFTFLMKSLSNDVEIRTAFFESLKKAENREKEAWVLTALNYLNHPLRASTSESYITPSLELLEEIQLTGDIFFPKRWLTNSIGRYSSASAYTKVQDFLSEHPDLNHTLKSKLLQAADPLFRAQKIKQ